MQYTIYIHIIHNASNYEMLQYSTYKVSWLVQSRHMDRSPSLSFHVLGLCHGRCLSTSIETERDMILQVQAVLANYRGHVSHRKVVNLA